MAINKADLEKLTPEQRIRRLKEMEEERKREAQKDAQEIEALINKSMQEMRTDKIAEKFAPRQQDTDISKLFTQEEIERSSQPRRAEESAPSSYALRDQIATDYQSLKRTLGDYISPGQLSQNQIDQLDTIKERLSVASYQRKSLGEEMTRVMTASGEALTRIRKYAGLE